MKFTTAAAVAVILGAESVLAGPVNLVPRAPRASRRSAARSSHPKVPAAGSSHFISSSNIANNSQIDYSGNWAGAVLIGSSYKTIVGTFTVPTPKVPSGGDDSTSYSASAWVGLDGDTCQTSILQTGIDFNIEGGSVSYDAWYEWYPDYAYNFDGFDISAGDVIKLTATAKSLSAGSVTIENQSTGKTVSHSFTGESAELCETNAEWIVEDFNEGDSQVPFANFGTVTFTDSSVTLNDGSIVGVAGANISDIKQSGKVLTSVSISGESTVKISYI